ncbi:MAG: hypothetical protein IH849_03820 [Acidobacteria bacterium]|nr:hypothetical protein [Acidobacteriota bacterium]
MDRRPWLLLLVIPSLLAAGPAPAQEPVAAATEAEEELVSSPELDFFGGFRMDLLPGGGFYTTYLEAYAPDTTLLIEESNGFALIDNPRVYYEGDPQASFGWHLDGFDIGSALNPGAAAVLLPFAAVGGYRLEGEGPTTRAHGFSFVSRRPLQDVSRLSLSGAITRLGEDPWASFLINNPATSRAVPPPSSRRRLLRDYAADYLLHRQRDDSGLTLAASYREVGRRFNDFNERERTYDEDGRLLLASARYRRQMARGHYEVLGVYNYLDRDNLHAEIGSFPQETRQKTRHALFAGFRLEREVGDVRVSLQHERESLAPFAVNFTKELQDNDGDGFYPFFRFGDFSATTINVAGRMPLRQGGGTRLTTFADLRQSWISGDEETDAFNPITFDGDPYSVILWDGGGSYSSTNARLRAGVDADLEIGRGISLVSKLFVQYGRLGFDDSGNNVSVLDPGLDVGLRWRRGRTSALLAYGTLPYAIEENVNFFLERGRPSGTIARWDDDGNGLFDPGEAGKPFGFTGGRFHFVDEDLSAPRKRRLLLTLSTPISRRFRFDLKGLYKWIDESLAVRFREQFGFFEPHGDRQLFFFDRPFGDFYLTNPEFEDDPFYAQALVRVHGGEPGEWFFSFSFMAHIGMGVTRFGNGADSNDIGFVGESQADPNSLINGFGRVDGDRAYVARSAFGFRLASSLFLGVSIKYRDGAPFAFINSVQGHDQRALYYATIKAEDRHGRKGGPREDYLGDLSVKLAYALRLLGREALLGVSFFNLLDVGYELSEHVFSGGSRDANELNIPRTMRLSLTVSR